MIQMISYNDTKYNDTYNDTKNDTNDRIYITETDSQTSYKTTYGYQRGKGGGDKLGIGD